MNKNIHNAILHLAKAVLCKIMILVLSFMLLVTAKYPIILLGIFLLIMILSVMFLVQLCSFVGCVIKGNRK